MNEKQWTPEQYVVTPEDEKKARETMTPTQEVMSNLREKLSEKGMLIKKINLVDNEDRSKQLVVEFDFKSGGSGFMRSEIDASGKTEHGVGSFVQNGRRVEIKWTLVEQFFAKYTDSLLREVRYDANEDLVKDNLKEFETALESLL